MKPNVILISIIAVLLLALTVMGVFYANSRNKAELNQLKQVNLTLNDQVKELSADGHAAHQEAAQLQRLYVNDTLQLAALQYRFDSLTGILTHLKTVTHAQTKAIGLLSDAATDSLYTINKARFERLLNP